MKKTIILATAILLASSAFADHKTIKDRTNDWLQRETTEETTPSGNLRGFADGKTENELPGVPVGAIPGPLVLALCGTYLLKIRSNKK
ncbi:MAG: hypothetical protein LBS25_00550 [Candidatus Symbiothrix sp.]|jgi:hypothetical protein|nr:hypothetical protein [Candidatus Symbiothrix sp.]